MDYPFQKLEKQYRTIPPDVRRAISSTNVGEKLMEIGKKYNLHIDKLDKLFGTTGFVMLGITHPRDYIKHLSHELGVDETTARAIATEVNEEIYRPVKESLKKMYTIQQEGTQQEKEEAQKKRCRTTFKLTCGRKTNTVK